MESRKLSVVGWGQRLRALAPDPGVECIVAWLNLDHRLVKNFEATLEGAGIVFLQRPALVATLGLLRC